VPVVGAGQPLVPSSTVTGTAAPGPAPLGGLGADHGYGNGPFEQPKQSWIRRKLSAAGAAIVALLAKLKAILLLLPKFKLLATAGTMVVSIVAYGSIWGFAFGAGFVLLILVHEMGHVIQLRREGIKASAPIFIPFLGAVIGSRSLGDNALAEARVGLAGPVLGSIGAAVCLVIWHATGNAMWGALAYTGFFLNLFNLIPMVPLDGGRAMAAMAPWMWVAGFAGLAVLAFLYPNPIFILILLLGAYEIYRRWQRHRSGAPVDLAYYKVAPLDRARVAAVYLILIALLVVGMHATNLPRTII
jgi:Zn-dependent protease